MRFCDSNLCIIINYIYVVEYRYQLLVSALICYILSVIGISAKSCIGAPLLISQQFIPRWEKCSEKLMICLHKKSITYDQLHVSLTSSWKQLELGWRSGESTYKITFSLAQRLCFLHNNLLTTFLYKIVYSCNMQNAISATHYQ